MTVTAPDSCDQLCRDHMWLVDAIVAEKASRVQYPDVDSMRSDAQLGLFRAAQQFDDSRGVRFTTYATYRIRGAISDGFRQRDFSRIDRRMSNVIESTRQRLSLRLQRKATSAEVARDLGWTEKELSDNEAYIDRFHVRRLDWPIGDTDLTLGGFVADEKATADLLSVETRHLLAKYLPRLRPKEHFVIGMFYWQGCTMREIGDVLGVTESRICQIKQRALERLRLMMAHDAA